MRLFLILAMLLSLVANAQAAVLVFSPNGAYVTKTDLATFAASADCAGKTAVITSPQTVTTGVHLHTDRSVEIKRGGVISTSGAGFVNFSGAVSVQGEHQAFSPTATVRLYGSNQGSPKWWGAKGNGVTDDTVPCQAALTAGPTYWPDGQYLVSSTLTAAYSIEFASWSKTALIAKPNTTINPVLQVQNPSGGVVKQRFVNITIAASARSTNHQSGIVFKGVDANNGVALLEVRNLHVANMNGYGVKLDTVWDSAFPNLHIEDCGSSVYAEGGLWLGSTRGDSTNQCTFTTLQTERCRYRGIDLTPESYSNTFIGHHAEWNAPIPGGETSDLVLGGYRNTFIGSQHLGAYYTTIWTGGEGNLYNGIRFEAPTKGLNTSHSPHKFESCTFTAGYDQNGASDHAVFNACDISGGLTASGEMLSVYGGTIDTLYLVAESDHSEYHDTTIGAVSQGWDNTASVATAFYSCTFTSSVTFTSPNVKIHDGQALSNLTMNYGGPHEIKGTHVFGNLVLHGNTTAYKNTVSFVKVDGNLTVDSGQGAEINSCVVLGTASEPGGTTTNKLLSSVVKSTVTGFTVQGGTQNGTTPAPTVAGSFTAGNGVKTDSAGKLVDSGIALDALHTGGSGGVAYAAVGPGYTTWVQKFSSGYRIAAGYVPTNGTTTETFVFPADLFTQAPYCVVSPAAGPNKYSSVSGIAYNSTTHMVTVSVWTNDTAIGQFLMCFGN